MHLNRFGIANHNNFHESCSLLVSRIQVGYNVHYLCSITARKKSRFTESSVHFARYAVDVPFLAEDSKQP